MKIEAMTMAVGLGGALSSGGSSVGVGSAIGASGSAFSLVTFGYILTMRGSARSISTRYGDVKGR